MKITPLTTEHADELSALAKAIYQEYYLHLWNEGGADWYMNEFAYHPSKLKEEIADSNNLHYIIYDAQDQPLGFLKLKIDAILGGAENKNCLEVERIYLHKSAAGKGIGKRLMLLSEEVARQHNKKTIFLKAMDSSHDAIAFYRKMGYTNCGELTLPFPQMKKEYRGMIIMQKNI